MKIPDAKPCLDNAEDLDVQEIESVEHLVSMKEESKLEVIKPEKRKQVFELDSSSDDSIVEVPPPYWTPDTLSTKPRRPRQVDWPRKIAFHVVLKQIEDRLTKPSTVEAATAIYEATGQHIAVSTFNDAAKLLKTHLYKDIVTRYKSKGTAAGTWGEFREECLGVKGKS
jgi:hypothetical protein